MPPAGPGRVLITTQNQHWPPGQAIDVPVLDPEVTADFLVNRTGDADQAAARELADQTGGLPLALEQAAAYMQATGTTLARYLPLFRGPAGRPAGPRRGLRPPGRRVRHAGAGVVPAGGRSPAAAGLMRLLAFLAPEPVPLALLLASQDAAGLLDVEPAAAIGPVLDDRSPRGTRSPRCGAIPWSARLGTAWCWCTAWCRPSPAPGYLPRRRANGNRRPPPWSMRRFLLTRGWLRRGRRSPCCCRTPGSSST